MSTKRSSRLPVNLLSLLEALAIHYVEPRPSTLFCGCLGHAHQLFPPPAVMAKLPFTGAMRQEAPPRPADVGSGTQRLLPEATLCSNTFCFLLTVCRSFLNSLGVSMKGEKCETYGWHLAMFPA